MEEVIDKVVEYLDNSINKIDNVYYSIYEKSESVYLELFFPKSFKLSKFNSLVDKVNDIYKTVLNYKYEIKISDSDYDEKEDENYIIFRIKKFSYNQNYQSSTGYSGGKNNYNEIYNRSVGKPEFNRVEWERNLSHTGIEIGMMEAIEMERGLTKIPMDKEEIDYITSMLKLMSTQGANIDGPHRSHANYDHFWLIYIKGKDGTASSSSYSLSIKKLSNGTFIAKLLDFNNFSKMIERYLYLENIMDFSGIAVLNKFDI